MVPAPFLISELVCLEGHDGATPSTSVPSTSKVEDAPISKTVESTAAEPSAKPAPFRVELLLTVTPPLSAYDTPFATPVDSSVPPFKVTAPKALIKLPPFLIKPPELMTMGVTTLAL